MLTAYWMVKDDAEGLRHSIASVRENLDADEYVVLDTGSQDGTVAVAEEALSGMNGKPVSIRQQTFPDPMHFGDARNVALQECHGDWVFQIDSDEFITQCDAKALKKLLAETPPEVKLYKVPTLLCGMDPNVPAGHTMLPRLFRQGVQYTFGYHEVPALALEEGRECHLLTLRHSKEHRAPEREAIRDLQRTECSEKWFIDLEGKEPDEKWRSLMYLGVNRMGHGELESAVDLFREALADGAVRAGMGRAEASLLAASTLEGAARMVRETGKHPAELKDMVTSPGGTTAAGVAALERGAFRATVMDAVLSAWQRCRELSG